MIFIYVYIFYLLIYLFIYYFQFLLAHRLRYAPVLLSDTVHTDSFTANNNNNNNNNNIMHRVRAVNITVFALSKICP